MWTGSPSTSGEMVVWIGGGDCGWDPWAYCAQVARYDPIGNSWKSLPLAGAPANRSGYTSVWTGDVTREMVIWGGHTCEDLDGCYTWNNGAAYNPETNTWHSLSQTPLALSDHTTVWTGSEMIV